MSLKVVKGFSIQLNLNLKKSEEEEAICLSIQDNLPQLVVEQRMCQSIGQTIKGKTYLDILKVCKCQFSQEYLYLVENLAKKNKIEKTIPVQFSNLENEQEKMKFLTQDQLVNNVILTKNSYDHNEENITIYDFSNISELMQLFLNNFWIEVALSKDSNQLLSKLIFNNVTFVINKVDSSSNLQIVSNPVMQLLASKAQEKIALQAKQNEINQKKELLNEGNQNQGRNTIRTGYLSMDNKQRIVPLLAQDEGVYKVPLIGIWIQSDENVNDIFLWTLFIEYAKNGAMKKCNLSNSSQSNQNSNSYKSSTPFSAIPNYSDISFLFVWFQSNNITCPLFFQISITQSSINKCFQKAQMSSGSSVIKFDYRYSKFKPVNIIENGLNHTFEAQDIIKGPIKPPSSIYNDNQNEKSKQQIMGNNEKQQLDSQRQQNTSQLKSKEKSKEDLASKSYKSSSINGIFSNSILNKNESTKEDKHLLKSSLTNTQEDFLPKKENSYRQYLGDNCKSSLNDSCKDNSFKLSTRDLNVSLNQSKSIDKKSFEQPKKEVKQQQLGISKTRSQSYNTSSTAPKLIENSILQEKPAPKSYELMEQSTKLILEKQKLQQQQNNKADSKSEKEVQLFYKSNIQNANNQANTTNFTQFQQNTLKQHQILYEQNSKIDELEKQIQLLKKELQFSKSKDKHSPRILNSGSSNGEYSTVKKRSSKSVYNIGNLAGNNSGSGSAATNNTNDSKVGTKFVSRINQMESPSTNIIQKNSHEKVKDNSSLSSHNKSYRNQFSANSQATTTTGNKSIDSRLFSQNQNTSFNNTNKFLNSNKYLSSSSSNKDIELTIGQLQSNEKPPLGCLSTARSNQLRSSIKNLNQRLNTQRTSSSKQLKNATTSSGSGANIKRCRFLECNDELPRIKFDFSNIQDNEDSEDDSSNEHKDKNSKLLSYKLNSQSSSNKINNYKLNSFIDL